MRAVYASWPDGDDDRATVVPRGAANALAGERELVRLGGWREFSHRRAARASETSRHRNVLDRRIDRPRSSQDDSPARTHRDDRHRDVEMSGGCACAAPGALGDRGAGQRLGSVRFSAQTGGALAEGWVIAAPVSASFIRRARNYHLSEPRPSNAREMSVRSDEQLNVYGLPVSTNVDAEHEPAPGRVSIRATGHRAGAAAGGAGRSPGVPRRCRQAQAGGAALGRRDDDGGAPLLHQSERRSTRRPLRCS